MEGILSGGNLTGTINGNQRLDGTANGNQKLSGSTIPRGNDGVSPTIDIAPIEGGTRVTITDINGTKYFDVFGGISTEQIGELIREHLEDNPPEFEESDPTVPSWAKQPTKPEYTAEEVGALPADSLQPAINEALAQAKASGEFNGKDGKDGTDGQDGYTPVKGVDYFDGADGKDGKDGQDGYTPQKNIDYFDGKDGKDGVNGKDGYTPQKGIDYFDGKDGQPGADGKTPVKGTDYWTATDKSAMVSDVLAALPTWTGGSY